MSEDVRHCDDLRLVDAFAFNQIILARIQGSSRSDVSMDRGARIRE